MKIKTVYLYTFTAVFLLFAGIASSADMCYPLPEKGSNALYVDGVEQYWNAWQYGSIADTDAIETGMNGSHAIKVQYTRKWGEFILFRSDQTLWHTNGVKALVFRIKGIYDNCGKQIWVYVRGGNGQSLGSVQVTDYMVSPEIDNVALDCWDSAVMGGMYDSNKWYTVVIPLSALNAENVFIKDVVFEGGGELANYGAGDTGTIYLDDIWWVEGLEFPIKGDTAYTATISSVFDHVSSESEFNCRDEWVVAYTGEVGHSNNGESTWSTSATGSSCSGQTLRGYSQDEYYTKFSLNGQYDDDPNTNEEGKFLFYDGHTGYDFPVTDGTSFYAVADGTVETATVGKIVVNHYNGYKSYYLHNSTVNIGVGKKVKAGVTKLGETGAGHLHLTIKLYDVRVDPYGWDGDFDDPSRAFIMNIPLWKE